MSRTILYYPNIEIPTAGTWIRRALLYWDHVAAIVPRSYGNYNDDDAMQRCKPELRSLYEQQIFRPLNPSSLFFSGVSGPSFTEELKDCLNALPRIQRGASRRACMTEIYKDKTSSVIFDDLAERGLAEDRDISAVYLFEPTTARIYMSLLAKHLAAAQETLTIPGTDSVGTFNIINGRRSIEHSVPALSARINGLLPVPDPSVPLSEIIKFRRRHQSELLAFRAVVDDLEQALSKAQEQAEILGILEKFKEKGEREVIQLQRAFSSFRITTVLGSIQALIKPTSPTLWLSSAALLTNATTLATVPIPWVIAGVTVAGSIDVGLYNIGRIAERRKALEEKPFSYIFLAQRQFTGRGRNAKA